MPAETQAQVKPHLGNTSHLLQQAKAQMQAEEFEKANYYFRQIIESGVPIPTEMPYFFAKTLFELKQYDNSSKFLKKYLEINGEGAQQYKMAKTLEAQLESPLEAIKNCSLCNEHGYQYQTCSNCKGEKKIESSCSLCKGKGIIGCSHCVGTGLITKKNIFNITEYFECRNCNGKGRLICPECKGSLVETRPCQSCLGTGKIPTDILCKHQP
ncbi:molecular chaperone DnaJ [Echinicola jeungdonensis]|uniref:Molecular chaperone DnaJ n=1 Tax=Echinicola jeungdonensis TaxID=709343 RepID=A0ABV5J727_9BACT|nr:molecular chaperone DnaJ [Echinicola jeungdonensis]MDN3670748.1 molecular chaperone DnaJ [Echinicola jeungdonensis]